jgi:hypothetical protein
VVAAAANLADPDVPIRNRAVLVCGVGLALLTFVVIVVAMIVALVR